MRVDPVHLDRALKAWNAQYGADDEEFAIDDKTMCNAIDISGKTITVDALHTQRSLARYLSNERDAHFVFTVKNNHPTLQEDIRQFFENRGEPDFSEPTMLVLGRIESRSIWTSTKLNDYLKFPCVGQVFAIQRYAISKKSGKDSGEIVYGITSHVPESADAGKLLAYNRKHWGIESLHYRYWW